MVPEAAERPPAKQLLAVANFGSYQHREASRRKGGMLFIRLDVGTRLRPEFQGRGGRERYAQWCAILEWAGETNNRIPWAAGAWRREFGSGGTRVRDYWINAEQVAPADWIEASECRMSVEQVSSEDRDSTVIWPSDDSESAQRSHPAPIPARKVAGTDEDVDVDKPSSYGSNDLALTMDRLGLSSSQRALWTLKPQLAQAWLEAAKTTSGIGNLAAWVHHHVKAGTPPAPTESGTSSRRGLFATLHDSWLPQEGRHYDEQAVLDEIGRRERKTGDTLTDGERAELLLRWRSLQPRPEAVAA